MESDAHTQESEPTPQALSDGILVVGISSKGEREPKTGTNKIRPNSYSTSGHRPCPCSSPQHPAHSNVRRKSRISELASVCGMVMACAQGPRAKRRWRCESARHLHAWSAQTIQLLEAHSAPSFLSPLRNPRTAPVSCIGGSATVYSYSSECTIYQKQRATTLGFALQLHA